MRIALLALITLAVFSSACAEPQCPPDYVMNRGRCKRCPGGSDAKGDQCISVDGGTMVWPVQADDDAGMNASVNPPLDAAVGPDSGSVLAPDGATPSENNPTKEAGTNPMSLSDADTSVVDTGVVAPDPCQGIPQCTACSNDGQCPDPGACLSATDYIKNGASCLRRNIYVATSGSDTAAGTQAAPYRTYDRALNGAISGQVINFAAGSYVEAFSRAIPDGVTLQRTSGDIGTVVFTGTGTQTVVFAGSGTVRQLRLNTMGAPLRATTGTQTLESVSTVSPGGPIQLSGTANMTITDSTFAGSPAAGSEAYASLIRVKGSARLTMRGASSLTGSYACGSGADQTSAIYATDSTQVDLNGTSILGAFYSASLYFDGSATLQMTNCTMDLGASCGTGTLLSGSTTLVATGGSYDPGIAVNGANVRLEIDGGTYADVIVVGSSFRARNARFGIVQLSAMASMAADLGTAASPGNNTLSSTDSYPFGLLVVSGSPDNPTVVNVSGNTWQPTVQGADARGHYAVGAVSTSGSGKNYSLMGSVELHF